MILGTAGHIDHGKTTLVRALTGVDTDRLPEEKRRGITIDLGFAPLALDGVGQVGVVDVPGHEAFVRTMVAGATGIDFALLVVAGDAGVMPQTREHVAILSLLGVRAGVVAITKSDLADDEWLSLVEEDVDTLLASTPLAGAEIVRVSGVTGAGMDALRAALASAATRIAQRPARDLFRLPVDRAFTVKGTGTVVTGTVWSGTLARDASVRLLPSDRVVRVRGLQAHGRAVDEVRAGERAAIALSGVDVADVHRGAVLVQGDAWRASRVLRADVTLLGDVDADIGPRSRVRLHLGTSDVGARIVVRDRALTQGTPASARIVLDEPVVARGGDRFVLRLPSPLITLGGGTVTDPHAPGRARAWTAGDHSAGGVLSRMLEEAGTTGLEIRDLSVRLGVLPDDVDALLLEVNAWRVGSTALGDSARSSLFADAQSAVREHHGARPLDAGIPLQLLRAKLRATDDIVSGVVEALVSQGVLATRQRAVSLPTFSPSLDAAQLAMRSKVLDALLGAGNEPPALSELARALDAPVASVTDVARWLLREGTLVAVEPERYYPTESVARLRGALASGMAGDREYSPAELRDLLGLTRKFLIPFLEYCDREC